MVGWRLKDRVAWIFEEFRISLDETTVGRTMRKLGFRKLSTRPQAHGQNEAAMEDFKKAFLPRWMRSGRNYRPVRLSNSGGRTRRAWARRTRAADAGLDAEHAPVPRAIGAPAKPSWRWRPPC